MGVRDGMAGHGVDTGEMDHRGRRGDGVDRRRAGIGIAARRGRAGRHRDVRAQLPRRLGPRQRRLPRADQHVGRAHRHVRLVVQRRRHRGVPRGHGRARRWPVRGRPRTPCSSRPPTASRPTSSTAATSPTAARPSRSSTPRSPQIDTVTYADLDPWPVTPDGTGPSLELRDLAADNTLPASWGASLATGGTPRAVNSINGTGAAPASPSSPPPRRGPTRTRPSSCRPGCGSAPPRCSRYKVMFGADVAVPMLDDAASPGGAGDGVFAATIPGQVAGPARPLPRRRRVERHGVRAPGRRRLDPLPRRRGPQPGGQQPAADHRVVHGGRRLQRHPRQPPLRRLPGRGRAGRTTARSGTTR